MTTTTESVTKSITVEAPQARAFEVFTDGFASWWPLDSHHIGDKPAATAVIEPRAGGRWFEVAADGSECDWGTVIAYEAPERVLLGWQLDADWRHDPDLVTEVEVRFIAESDSRTRVELEHRDLGRFGGRVDEVRNAISSDQGWSGLLAAFAEAARA
jgi:uncharacterized protein YndB with AHSA1/START domain